MKIQALFWAFLIGTLHFSSLAIAEEDFEIEATPLDYIDETKVEGNSQKAAPLADDNATCAADSEIFLTDGGKACTSPSGTTVYLEDLPREEVHRLMAKHNPGYDADFQSGFMQVKGNTLSREELFSQCQFKADRAKCMNELTKRQREASGVPQESNFERARREAREAAADPRYRQPAGRPDGEAAKDEDPCAGSRRAGFRDAYLECLRKNNLI